LNTKDRAIQGGKLLSSLNKDVGTGGMLGSRLAEMKLSRCGGESSESVGKLSKQNDERYIKCIPPPSGIAVENSRNIVAKGQRLIEGIRIANKREVG
jgi:hypothetical protein